MDTQTLFYKQHSIHEKDIELIFHKEYTYMFNDKTPFPVVKFTLVNCDNLSSISFENIDYYNDGVVVEIYKENHQTIFRTTDIGDIEVEIKCTDVRREELEYKQTDLIDILKSIKKESDDSYERSVVLAKRLEGLKTFLIHDIDIIQRKLEQASWLTSDKKQFLEGQKNVVNQVLQYLDEKQNEDFQRRQSQQNSRTN